MRSVKDVLNIKNGDSVLCYGLNEQSSSLIKNLPSNCSITVLPLDSIEHEKSAKLKVKIRSGISEMVNRMEHFDRIFCCYKEIPNSLREFKRVMNDCYSRCAFEGLILIRNLTEKSGVEYFVNMKHIRKSWMLKNPDGTFDLLLKKEK